MKYTKLFFVLNLLIVAMVSAAPSTQPLREEQQVYRAELLKIATQMGTLQDLKSADQRKVMKDTISFFVTKIRPFWEWQEVVLYPEVDKLTNCAGGKPYTAALRLQLHIEARWADDLKRYASMTPEPDVRGFIGRAYNVTGLLLAHLEQNDQVVFPILDKAMDAATFKKNVFERGRVP